MTQETISINIKPEAKEIIEKKNPENKPLLLALNDSSNKYSRLGGTCTIGVNFQFVILDEKDPKYTIKVENNAGFDLWTSPDEVSFFEGGLVVNARNYTLSLSDDSGILDGAVSIDKYTPQELTKKEMQEGKTC